MSAPPVPPRRSSVSITNPPVPPRRNSFGKAMLLALIALIPITIASRGSKDPAYTVGFFGAVPILAGFAVGIWAKVAKSRWSWFAYIWRFLAGTFAVFVLELMGNATGSSVARITESEKHRLVVAERAASHPDFGFAVPLPTEGFQFDEALQRTANEDFTRRGIAATTYAWVLRGPEQAGVVILMVMKGAGGSESALRGLGRGLKRGTGQEGGRIIEDTMEWSPDAHEYRLGMLQRGVYIRSRCMSSQRSAAASYILCVETVSADSMGLDETRAGARVAS